MNNSYINILSQSYPHQNSPLDSKQIRNAAGGYVYKITPMEQFRRFLILGSDNGTYYASAASLTKQNYENIIEIIKSEKAKIVDTIVEVSVQGRAPKNDAAIFALALCTAHGDAETKKAAYKAIPKVCRIGTHLFMFCEFVQKLRGWSRGLRKGVSNFYLEKSIEQAALQIVKYRQRNGWTHKDVLRLCHASQKEKNELFQYAVGKSSIFYTHHYIEVFEKLQACTDVDVLCKLIKENNFVTWEFLPTKFLTEKKVMETLFPTMPMTALLRNLGKLYQLGITEAPGAAEIIGKFTSEEIIKRSRLHPLQILTAMKVLEREKGIGSGTYMMKCLEQGFHHGFETIEPMDKRVLIGLDISGSMSMEIGGKTITCAEASAAIAMSFLRKCRKCDVMGFSHVFIDLGLTADQPLTQVMSLIRNKTFGNTDCSLPIRYAIEKGLSYDLFLIITDNETWSGKIHPRDALTIYRNTFNPSAKLAVVGMTATDCSIADPSDPGQINLVGFDTSIPTVLAEFMKGF